MTRRLLLKFRVHYRIAFSLIVRRKHALTLLTFQKPVGHRPNATTWILLTLSSVGSKHLREIPWRSFLYLGWLNSARLNVAWHFQKSTLRSHAAVKEQLVLLNCEAEARLT